MIAGALGYAPVEVRRLAALSGLHAKALQALKLGRMTLRQARLLARLPEKTLQVELADYAMQGHGFQEWRALQALDERLVTTDDRRFALVGPDRYAAAGGRTEADLFGERPDVLLDPELLHALWTDRVRTLSAAFDMPGADLAISAEGEPEPPAGLDPFGYRFGLDLDEAAQTAWREAQGKLNAAVQALSGADLASAEQDAGLINYLRARVATTQATEPGRPVTIVVLFPGHRSAVDVACFAPPTPEVEMDEDSAAPIATVGAERAPTVGEPLAAAAEPVTEGVNHALHEVRTDTATRALLRALADDPGAALVALIARLFSVLVLRAGVYKGGGALTVCAEAYGRPRSRVIETLDGDVRRRLAERRSAWEASGLSLIAWAAALPHGEKMATLAELTAISLDLREERTSPVRRQARAEAAELAALCNAQVTVHWTPDEPFLRAHPKPQLLSMLAAMDVDDPRAAKLKKDELVALVVECSAERGWAPAWLSWRASTDSGEESEPEPEGEAEGALEGSAGDLEQAA